MAKPLKTDHRWNFRNSKILWSELTKKNMQYEEIH